MVQLDLTNDIYVVGVLQFLYHDSAQAANRVVFKCVFAFSLQFALIALLLYQYSNRGDANIFSTIFAGTTSLNATRLLVAVLLNLQVLPEVQEALSIMDFTISSPGAYRGNRFNWPMGFMLMKVLGGFCSLMANVFVILH